MNDWRYEPINRHDTVTIRIIWVAFLLSLLVHIAALWTSPPLMRSLAFEPSDKVEPSQALIAQLVPRATPSPPESAPPPHTAVTDRRGPRLRPPAPHRVPRRLRRPSCATSRPRARFRRRRRSRRHPRRFSRPQAARGDRPVLVHRGKAQRARRCRRDVRIQRAQRAAGRKREGTPQPHRRREPRLEQDAHLRRRPQARRRNVPDTAHRLRRCRVHLQRLGPGHRKGRAAVDRGAQGLESGHPDRRRPQDHRDHPRARARGLHLGVPPRKQRRSRCRLVRPTTPRSRIT